MELKTKIVLFNTWQLWLVDDSCKIIINDILDKKTIK